MITLIGPDDGGIAHVARSLGAHLGEMRPVNLLLVSDRGVVAHASCDCTTRPQTPARGLSVAGQAARSAWLHRACLRSSSTFHLELGRVSVSTFWFALVASWLAPRTPLVTSVHDLPTVLLHPAAALMRCAAGWRDAIAFRVISPLAHRPVMAALRRRTSITVVLSSAAAGSATAAGWPRVSQVSHGAAERTAGAASPADGGYVLLAGYLGPGKGLDVLAKAWSQVASGLRLVIAGGHSTQHAEWVGQIRAELDGSPNPPQWLGFVDDDAFEETIANAAIVLIPYEEANPVSGVLIRALVEGRAVIGTRLSAVTDEVADGVNGILVDPGDPDGLARAILLLSAQPQLRQRLGDEAARRAMARHSWTEHAHALAGLHDSLVGDASGRSLAGYVSDSRGEGPQHRAGAGLQGSSHRA